MDKLFKRVRFPVSVLALITLLAGLALTALLFTSVRRVESERHNLQLQQSAKLCTTAAAAGLYDAAKQVMVLNQLFSTFGIISHAQFHSPLTPRWLWYDHADPVSENFNLAGSPWRMEAPQAPVPFTAAQGGSLYVLLGGILSSLLAAAYVYLLASRTATMERVTGRNLLRACLTQAIAGARRKGTPIWVVFVDLDRFKFVNDTLGHDAGDMALQEISLRMQACLRASDTIARLGADEFMLVLPEHTTEDGPGSSVLQRIMDAVARPLMIHEHEFFLTCSIGVAAYPADGETAEILTRHADIAMYRAKEMGRNTFQFYTPAMNERTLDRLAIEADLRHALERGEFILHYQPQIRLSSGDIVGMEALIRWNHPRHGLIAPARFIGLAEEMGLIIPIGAWVLRTACIQTKTWQRAGLGDLRVAVNISPRQFTQKALLQSIADVLRETGLEPRCLELELTESMVMGDVDNAIEILRKLKGLGIHISIDDFGTGYSSLSYLRRFPIDVLKIDQSFVSDLTVDADDAAIVVAIISLAHSLRLQVIAEGVETAEQLAFLRAHGCDQVQGYYFSKPVEPEAFEQMLIEENCLSHRTSHAASNPNYPAHSICG